MSCDLEWVTIDEVEGLWSQFVFESDAAAEAMRFESAENYEHFAGETLDVLLWCLEGEGGYWWCGTCKERHIIAAD